MSRPTDHPTDNHEDPIDRLTQALRQAPAPAADAKADAMARALAAFDENSDQAFADGLRSKKAPSQGDGPNKGMRWMLDIVTGRTKQARRLWLAGGSVAALTLGLAVILPHSQPQDMLGGPMQPAAEAPPPPAPALPHPQMEAAQALSRKSANANANAAASAKMAPAPMAMEMADAAGFAASGETYANEAPSGIQSTASQPVSTLAADVDTASYALLRNSLDSGSLPDPDALRIEEMVNYFPYDLPAPADATTPFTPSITVMETPWNPDSQLVRIALQGRLPALADRPPLDLVLLVDTSGSMDDPAKLPLLRQAFALMLDALRPEDRIAITAYAGSAGVVLPPTAAADKAAILRALDQLEPSGSTNGAEGLQLAYDLASQMRGQDGDRIGRVILATDGDFNIGPHDPAALERLIKDKAKSGSYLSVLGFGRGNLDDAAMQALAQNGNGQAAYIDTLQEAQKVLVDQLSGALFPIADDVKLQIEWNPAHVAEYRLIGYETRALAREDFNNDKVDAGEIGAGHQMTALYEITPPDSAARKIDPLRYGQAEPNVAPAPKGEELGFLRLRYKTPGETESRLIEQVLPLQTAPSPEANFAAAIAGFGQLLRHSPYLGDWGWDQAIALATDNRGADPYGYRAEAIHLMRIAKGLSR